MSKSVALFQSHLILVLLLLWSTSSNADQVVKELGILETLSEKLSKPIVQSDIQLQGQLLQGGIVRGWLPQGANVQIDERDVDQTDEGYFIFGFGRDADSEATLSWSENSQRFSAGLKVKARDYAIQRINGVPQSTVSPPQERLKRIRNETALVKKARKTFLNSSHFLNQFQIPVEGTITGVYGSQRVYNGVPKRPHFGVDYAAPTGTPVVAPADATVTLVHDNMYYSGGTLIIDHGYGFSSTFIHLSEILVSEGDEVKAGDVVAKVGAGGRATGPHLDWRINWYDVRLDPQLVLELKTAKQEN